METDVLGAAGQLDFSMLALFMKATITVKIVMIMLIFASIWSWAIIIDRLGAFRKVRAADAEFEKVFWSGRMLDEIHSEIDESNNAPTATIFAAGMEEWGKAQNAKGFIAGAQQRIDRAMNVVIARESERLNTSLGYLASIGAVSPFIGLFGTVWGIKHSFEQIAMQQSTDLAVVAPGIAEALLATAMGLVAAIPAVIFYNKLSADSDRIASAHENFADEFATILSRQLERRAD